MTGRCPLLLLLAMGLVGCGGAGDLEDNPLQPIPVDVDEELVEPTALRVEWSAPPFTAEPLRGDAAERASDDEDEEPLQPSHRPALGDRAVYVPYEDHLRALALDDGDPLWIAHLPGPVLHPPVPVPGGIAVVTEGAWNWLDADGRLAGRHPISSTPTDTVATGSLLLAADGTAVTAIDFALGEGASPEVLWRRELPEATALTLAPGGDAVVVTAGETGVSLLETASGRVRWSRGELALVAARAAADRRRVYVVGTDNRLRALDRDDGDTDWTSRAIGVRVPGAPVVLDDLVWVAGLDAALHAYAASSGSHLFRLPLSARVYVDLVTWGRWVIASPQTGPWVLVRGPLQATGPAQPGYPRSVSIPSAGGLELPPHATPLGVVVADESGAVRLLRPPVWASPEPPTAGVR